MTEGATEWLTGRERIQNGRALDRHVDDSQPGRDAERGRSAASCSSEQQATENLGIVYFWNFSLKNCGLWLKLWIGGGGAIVFWTAFYSTFAFFYLRETFNRADHLETVLLGFPWCSLDSPNILPFLSPPLPKAHPLPSHYQIRVPLSLPKLF